MIFDLIFAIFVGGLLSYIETPRELPQEMPREAGQATVADAPPAPAEVTDLAISQLACLGDPDPTIVLRAMMDHGLIHANDRENFESYSCFPIPGGMSLVGVNVNAVCGGVMSAAINAENPDLYPPNDQIADEDRYQMIAFGSNDDLDSLVNWRNVMFGMGPSDAYAPAGSEALGVIDGLYAPSISLNEIYCDDVLADDIAFAAEEAAAMEYMPPSDGSAPINVPPPPAPAPPAQ